jgi:hypothetical protein
MSFFSEVLGFEIRASVALYHLSHAPVPNVTLLSKDKNLYTNIKFYLLVGLMSYLAGGGGWQ